MKTFSRTAIAAALTSCYFAASAMAASPESVVLTSAAYFGNEGLPTLPTYNVASNANGEFAVSVQELALDRSELLIFNENGSGSSLAKPVTVPLTTTGYNAPSGLAVDKDGDVAVAWSQITGSYPYFYIGYTTITNTVYVQRYSKKGAAEGDPIVVSRQIDSESVSAANNGPEVIQASSFSQPQVAMDDDGDIAVAWTVAGLKCPAKQFYAYHYGYCHASSGSESSKTYAALYSSAGSVMVAPTVVDSLGYATASEGGYGHANLLAGMRMSGAGNLLLLYAAARDTTVSVAAHLFGPGLASTRGPFTLSAVHPIYAQYLASQTNTALLREHLGAGYFPPAPVFGGSNEPSYLSAVGMDASGNFDVAWLNGTNDAIYVTRYDSFGNAIGSNIGPIAKLVTSTNHSCGATVAAAGGDFQLAVSQNGSFAVTWGEALPFNGTDNYSFHPACTLEKYAQVYNPDGTAKGSAVVVSQRSTTGYNPDASLSAMDGNGGLVTIWNSIPEDGGNTTDDLNGELVLAP